MQTRTFHQYQSLVSSIARRFQFPPSIVAVTAPCGRKQTHLPGQLSALSGINLQLLGIPVFQFEPTQQYLLYIRQIKKN